MIIVLESGTSEEGLRTVVEALAKLGLRGNVLDAEHRPLIHVVEGPTRLARKVRKLEGVEALVATSGPRIRRQGRRFYPYHMIGWAGAGLLCLGVLVALAGFLPPGLGADPDPRAASAFVAPWFLRAPLALLRLFPGSLRALGWLALAAVALVLLFVPSLDRSSVARARPTPLRVLIAAGVLAGWFFLTFGGNG